MITASRPEVLAEVNATLAHEGLPTWNKLRRIGKHRDGEHEIIGVSGVFRDLKSYYVLIIFDVIRPDGSRGKYGVRTSKHIPTSVVTVVNDKLLLVKQHRLTTGTWTLEVPRGWVDAERAEKAPGGAGRVLLERELTNSKPIGLDLPDPVLIGQVWEDTGTRLDKLWLYYCEFQISEFNPSGRARHLKPALYTWRQVDELIDKGILNDQASITALFKAERYRRKLRSA